MISEKNLQDRCLGDCTFQDIAYRQLYILVQCSYGVVFTLNLHSNAKRMPIDVQDVFKSVCRKHGGLTEQEATDFIKKLETSKRLQLETWA